MLQQAAKTTPKRRACKLCPASPHTSIPAPLLLLLVLVQVLLRPYTLGWAVGCPLMFAVPVLVTLYLAFLLLPIPYWSRSRTAASTPAHQHSSAPRSSTRAGSIRLPDAHQRQQRRPWTWFPSRQLCWCSPDWYWRVPGARILLVVVFRTFLSVLPPLSVGILKPAAPLLQFNGYLQWSPFVQYAWRGWGAFTQLVGGGASQHARCLSAGMLVISCSTRRARCLPVALPPCGASTWVGLGRLRMGSMLAGPRQQQPAQ